MFISVIFLVNFCTIRAFFYFRPPIRLKSQFMSTSNGCADDLFKLLDGLTVQGNVSEALLNLIRLGEAYSDNIAPISDISKFHRVPSCTSDARLYTSLKLSKNDQFVKVEGYADAKIAQGMVAIFCKGLSNMSAKDVLALKSLDIITRSGLQSVLPPGRLNGFQHMLALIQTQIRSQLISINQVQHQSDTSTRESLSISDDDNERQQQSPPLPLSPPLTYDHRNEEIAVLLSGGVDSSVALKLLVDQGHKVRAYYLKIWLEDEIAHLNECPWEEDLQYANSVCEQLGVPLETLSLQKEYWAEYTLAEAKLGRTPNPDIMCNSRIKFGMFFDYVGKFHKSVATGHYAQTITMDIPIVTTPVTTTTSSNQQSAANDDVSKDSSIRVTRKMTFFKRAPDPVKDQTYFLCNLRQDQLNKAVFPIGHLQKSQVRELAQQFSLPTSTRKDSQGICFLGKLKFDDFISHYLGEKPGEIRCYDSDKLLGHHRGLWFHTVGQRKGLGLYMLPGTVNLGPWYVAKKDIITNTLYATNNTEVVEGPRKSFLVNRINWIAGSIPEGFLMNDNDDVKNNGNGNHDGDGDGIRLLVQLRHGANNSHPATVRDISSDNDRKGGITTLLVNLDKRDRSGIAEGQFAAFYKDDICLGAGVICGASGLDTDISTGTATATEKNRISNSNHRNDSHSSDSAESKNVSEESSSEVLML
eukprot:gene9415-19534_t